MYEFQYEYIKQKYGEKANCVMWIQTVSLYTQKQMIFRRLQKMLKQGLILQIMNQTDHCLKQKIKK